METNKPILVFDLDQIVAFFVLFGRVDWWKDRKIEKEKERTREEEKEKKV